MTKRDTDPEGIDYTEKRKIVQDHSSPFVICKQENSINDIKETLVRTEGKIEKLDMRINGSFEKMAIHVEDSIYWRRFIVGVAISLVLTITGGIYTAFSISYSLGQNIALLRQNTDKWNRLENMNVWGSLKEIEKHLTDNRLQKNVYP